MWVDAHLHLHDPAFDADREAVLARALAVRVGFMVSAGTSVESSAEAVGLAERYPQVWAAVGIHPASAAAASSREVERIEELARHPRVVAVGEIGLDYVRAPASVPVQVELYRAQVRLARRVGLPVVVHNRGADVDVERILVEEGATAVVMHCVSGPWEAAARWAARGWMLSFAGSVTFPAAAEVRESVRRAPVDRILVETDAPYLAPVPLRGRRCEPAFVVHTAQALADLRGVSVNAVEEVVERNARRVFMRGSGDIW